MICQAARHIVRQDAYARFCIYMQVDDELPYISFLRDAPPRDNFYGRDIIFLAMLSLARRQQILLLATAGDMRPA